MVVILLIFLISFQVTLSGRLLLLPQAEILLRRSTPQQPIGAGSRRCYGRHDRSWRRLSESDGQGSAQEEKDPSHGRIRLANVYRFDAR